MPRCIFSSVRKVIFLSLAFLLLIYLHVGIVVTSLCTHDYPKHFVCAGLSCVWTSKPLLSAYDDVEAPFTRARRRKGPLLQLMASLRGFLLRTL